MSLKNYINDLKEWQQKVDRQDKEIKQSKIIKPIQVDTIKQTTTATTNTNTIKNENIFDPTSESLKFKDKGNQLFAQQKYKESIECYTSAIQMDPTNSILYSNRAMAYIKLKNFNQAEVECTRCLNLDNTNLKAYHRRGLSRLELRKYNEAIQDFKVVLKSDPNNKESQNELNRAIKLKDSTPIVSPMKSISENDKQQPQTQQTDKIEISKDKNIIDTTTSTPTTTTQPIIEIKANSTPTSNKESTTSKVTPIQDKPIVEIKTTTTPATTITTTTEPIPKKSTTSSLQERLARMNQTIKAPIPKVAPKNSFEFEKTYLSFKKDLSSLYQYFKLIDPIQLPNILDESLTPSLFTDIISILDKYYLVNKEYESIYKILLNLLKNNRISLTIQFMDQSEKTIIKNILNTLLQNNVTSKDNIEYLINEYTCK
ncbi:hypothetical protein CYY_008915 [Polysphondylium violaceum]|uniref:RNA polymerase II-associated protein 3 n=1 Tax=Polysphondylium violaceum TaxID=133409 RepID=A0A8J4UWQ7_9MYCE|nr:hypothetical protein CYY_008915 [Polysphondylium violaceum]